MIFKKRFLPADSGESYDVIGGNHVTIKATGEDTDGAFTVIETIVPPHAGPPRHVHHRESETFYVVEGEFEFHVGDEKTSATAGAFLIAPPDVPHQFRNISDRPGKLLVVCQPAGFENFIKEFATLPANAPPDPARMAAIGIKYGIEFLPET
jgi:quercetin dioxygenase-like cupin family protein